MKICRKCGKKKPLDKYGIRTVNRRDGRSNICKECVTEDRRERRRQEAVISTESIRAERMEIAAYWAERGVHVQFKEV